jgi:hypothetical protein
MVIRPAVTYRYLPLLINTAQAMLASMRGGGGPLQVRAKTSCPKNRSKRDKTSPNKRQKSPASPAYEPYLTWKEPYITRKEPYIILLTLAAGWCSPRSMHSSSSSSS